LLLVEFTPLQQHISFYSLNLLLVEFTPLLHNISFHSLNLLFAECVMATAAWFVEFVVSPKKYRQTAILARYLP